MCQLSRTYVSACGSVREDRYVRMCRLTRTIVFNTLKFGVNGSLI